MPQKKKETLETALARLEEITALMEKPNIALDASLELYKEGVELTVFCAKKLEAAKQEVSILRKTAACLVEEPFTE